MKPGHGVGEKVGKYFLQVRGGPLATWHLWQQAQLVSEMHFGRKSDLFPPEICISRHVNAQAISYSGSTPGVT
jgi:hypothetical protein